MGTTSNAANLSLPGGRLVESEEKQWVKYKAKNNPTEPGGSGNEEVGGGWEVFTQPRWQDDDSPQSPEASHFLQLDVNEKRVHQLII